VTAVTHCRYKRLCNGAERLHWRERGAGAVAAARRAGLRGAARAHRVTRMCAARAHARRGARASRHVTRRACAAAACSPTVRCGARRRRRRYTRSRYTQSRYMRRIQSRYKHRTVTGEWAPVEHGEDGAVAFDQFAEQVEVGLRVCTGEGGLRGGGRGRGYWGGGKGKWGGGRGPRRREGGGGGGGGG
jgi:hypothetical protein